MLSPLPIDTILPKILEIAGTGKNLVIEAAPGAGKTTRVPAALLSIVSGQVMVLEPRRIAARMAARRIAQETGTRVGDLAGYQVRFEDVTSPATRLRFLTEGLLTRRLLSDPQLRGVDVVVLDEFHERHLDTDVALALLRRLQLTSRPDLQLIVMSATLDAAPIAAYLDNCPVVRSEGRLYEVEISYRPHSPAPLEQQVSTAITDSASDRIDGDILVFLPGAAEIRRALSTSEAVARRFEFDLVPLHGSLSAEDQDRAVRPGERRKVILSTNVAESSITIEGITVVIDSGLARVASDSTATGLPTLQVQRISKASAIQRAGRAGRLAPGRAIRLYTADDFHRRRDHESPEILTRELSSVLLQLRALRATDLPWFEPPPQEAISAATDLLDRLTSHEDERELARYPVHPRVARLLGEAKRRSVVRAACRIAAVLTSGERSTDPDAIHLLDGELSFAAGQTERQLLRLANAGRDEGNDDDVRIALLTAFPDRVARRRSEKDAQVCSGQAAILPSGWSSDFLVAIDIEDRREHAAPLIRLASAIKPEWLLDLFPERVRVDEELVWNRLGERVEAESRILYDAIPVEETKSPPSDVEGSARILAAKAIEAGLHRFGDPVAIESLLARSEFASRNSDLRVLTMEDVDAAIADMSYGLRSFSELQAASEGLVATLIGRLGQGGERVLSDVAPERVPLRGRQVKVHYPRGQQPYIASRLQDFFGLRETPRIGRGNIPLLVHLLAPNQRPVQVTTDLAGFWQKLYPQVRKELSRRYPKHAWPKNPA